MDDIITSSFLPALVKNFDEFPINAETFKENRITQNFQTEILFDAFQQYKIIENYDDPETKSLLIVLFCERLADYKVSYFNGKNEIHRNFMIGGVKELLRNFHRKTLTHIFPYYEEKLGGDAWKKEVGCINGFVTFIEHFLEMEQFKGQWLPFSLSVGLKLTEIHDDDWKLLGILVLQIILKKGNPLELKEYNIDNLIYEEISKIFQSNTNEEVVVEADKILLLCLKFRKYKSDVWSRRDDILEMNLDKLRLSSSVEKATSILNAINEIVLNAQLNLMSVNLDSYKEVCDQILTNDNTIGLRWSKSMLESLSNVVLFLNTTNALKAVDLLNSLLRNYLVFVFIVPKIILQNQIDNIKNLILAIFESTSIHGDNEYLDVFQCYLEVISNQMKSPNNSFGEADSLTKAVESYLLKIENIRHLNKVV